MTKTYTNAELERLGDYVDEAESTARYWDERTHTAHRDWVDLKEQLARAYEDLRAAKLALKEAIESSTSA